MLNFDAAPLMAIILCGEPVPPCQGPSENINLSEPHSENMECSNVSEVQSLKLPLNPASSNTIKSSASLPNTQTAFVDVSENLDDSTDNENIKASQKELVTYDDLQIIEEQIPKTTEDVNEKSVVEEKKIEKVIVEKKIDNKHLHDPKFHKVTGTLAPLDLLKDTPFEPGRYEGLYAGSEGLEECDKLATLQSLRSEGELWGIETEKLDRYRKVFNRVAGGDGKASGYKVRQEFLKSQLPNSVLAIVWRLSDMDKDGYLDADEFCVAMHLMEMKLQGFELPQVTCQSKSSTLPTSKPRPALPVHLVPPSKRQLFKMGC